MASKINRRTVLGGLATAAAMTSVTDLRARAASGDLDIGSLDLESLDVGSSLTPSDGSFAEASEALVNHVHTYGEIVWSELRWPQYPHIVLEHPGLTWTSVHLALRKPA